MKKIFLLLLFFVTLKTFAQNITGNGVANYIPKFSGTTSLTTSTIYQTGNNQFGIGTITPAAKLEVRNTCSTLGADVLNITNEQNCNNPNTTNNFLVIRGFNIATSVYTTRYLIDPNGRTGVNVAAPVAQLDVQPHTSTVNPLLLHNNTGTSIFSVLNSSNVGINIAAPAAQLDVQSATSSISPLLLHSNTGTSVFTVLNSGNTGIGTATPTTQLEVKAIGSTDPFLVRNSSGTQLLKVVAATGNVAVGDVVPTYRLDVNCVQGGAAQPPLRVVNFAGNSNLLVTNADRVGINLANPDAYSGSLVVGAIGTGTNALDLVSTAATGNCNQIRFYNSNAIRHFIADDRTNNYLLIKTGNAGGAATKLRVEGNEEVSGMLGVGITTPTAANAALAVKGTSSTLFDIHETSATSDWNAQIRFLSNTGVARHIITEDQGNLLIDPGFGGGANNKLKVVGDEDITGSLVVTNNASIAQDATVSGTFLSQSVAKATGRLLVGTNAQNSAYNSHKMVVTDGSAYFGGTVTFNDKIFTNGVIQIGNVQPPSLYGNYKLSVNGQIAAQEVNVITNAGWFDYVFDDDYKLQTLSDLKKYIKENKHLPDIPSAEDVCKKGVNLGEMNSLLLKKVEELSLYVIRLEERMNQIEKK